MQPHPTLAKSWRSGNDIPESHARKLQTGGPCMSSMREENRIEPKLCSQNSGTYDGAKGGGLAVVNRTTTGECMHVGEGSARAA